MAERMGGLPFWQVTFDAEGDADATGRDALLAEVPAGGIADLFVFSHGWNNDRSVARRLYAGFFGLLAGQLPAERRGDVGLAGVVWPSRRWADEPIPDFAPSPAAVGAGPDGAASAGAHVDPPTPVSSPTLDERTLADLHATFPTAGVALDRMAALLAGPPTDEAQAEFLQQLKEFSRLAGTPDSDGETEPSVEPRMLGDGPAELFGRFRDALRRTGVQLPGEEGGEAGIGDALRGVWNGAKEALRQATYWQMKNRAGVVGREGLGPLLGELHRAAPELRVHLIGHSFGARLVANALAGLPDTSPSPVRSLTLLQGAFSHFAFADPLPFDAGRRGALAGMQRRVDGPVTVCFSEHDSAVGTLYPLASLAARDDAAAGMSALYRWGGMGADGAQNADVALDGIQPVGPGTTYRFSPDRILNIDAGEVVRRGGPPSGAHSDIVHPELTWVVLSASSLV
ncbi:conserved protein of unknown function [Modestobacter italicus]|uniref:Serine-threonine protein kinase n=1 Tax=Modestobacter italicus (strain DSM 44449 / CECT 9708 / BC 501) TaxID=2732864 RepID=I4EX35_MODI5|nr:hypothetical protein [Modestobacter marinus]CCH87948.1 conserved protein of unknown function [Modestobacter marinus]